MEVATLGARFLVFGCDLVFSLSLRFMFYLRSVALRYSTCSDNAPPTPHPTHLLQLQYNFSIFVLTYPEAMPLTTEPFLLGSNWQLFLP